jgi:predicted house-cleaning noncanonical NTP pyrophosphatase (MazG superfamily)
MEKLVRDNIPDIIRRNGEEPQIRTATDEEYKRALLDKLEEEVAELRRSIDAPEWIEEMADVFEVITALNELKEASVEDVISVQLRKREERGAFKKRILWTKPSA